MKQFCYVVALTDGTNCYTRLLASGTQSPEERDWEEDNLGRLLQAGWSPVRETPMGGANGSYAYSLILLAKD